MKVLMISTDRKIFEAGSAVRARMLGYAAAVDELLIVILGTFQDLRTDGRLKFLGLPRWRAFFWRPEESFDLVTSQDAFETGIIARRLAKKLGAKLELQLHTDIGSPYFGHTLRNKIRKKIARFILPRADYIRVVSHRIKDYLIKKLNIPEDKIEIRPISVDLGKIKNAPMTIDLHQKYPQFEKIILMASRLEPEKNISLALNAMCEVTKKNPRIGLIIVGAGSEQILPTENIIVESWIEQATLYSYYKTADLFLLTSFYEGYGLTLIEAQAAGCKIVSTDVGVAREVGAEIIDYNSEQLAEVIIKNLA